MIKRMTECARPLSHKDIRVLEEEIGLTLPQEYQSFLLKYNGGRPHPNAFPIEGLENNPVGAIQIFFGIDDEIESCNLLWNHRVFNGRLPSNLLAVACDGSGDLICLSLLGDDASCVVFWDFYAEHFPPTYKNVYKVAPSFTAFIDGIFESPYK